MIPEVDRVLQGFCGTLLMDVAPHLSAEYQMGSAGTMGVMMLMAATEFDRAAHVRVEENADYRALFGKASDAVGDGALKDRLEAAARGADPSLKVSDLNKANAELAALLVDLQAHVEETDEPWARDVGAAIWDLLKRSASRRRVHFPDLGL